MDTFNNSTLKYTYKSSKITFSGIVVQILLALLSVMVILPIFWSFITSIKEEKFVVAFPPMIIPPRIVFENYLHAFTSQPIARFLFNSFILATTSTAISVFFAILCAYAFSRFEFRGKKFLMFFVIFTMMIPGITNLIPIYSVFSKIGAINNYGALIFLYLPMLFPVAVWVLKNFIDGVPIALEEAALIDGCSNFKGLFKIIIPVAMPGITAIMTINFVSVWNEFLMALLFTSEKLSRTMTVGIYNFMGFSKVEFGTINAASLISLLPALILFIIMRDKFISSLAEGAVKG